ncbi:MAG: SDR family NAD(P)-dependent oxidoreductase [Gammaproteobacteria bacterium]
MHNLQDKIAVITGAASGIGRALAERCLRERMQVMLADVETETLTTLTKSLRARGGRVQELAIDVAEPRAVEQLADKTFELFGAVHLLFNNAGVAGPGAGGVVWRSKAADWEWVIGVNLLGVVNGLRSFVPRMLAQDTPAHIVNTASMAGLIGYDASAAYHASKHAVVALSENLYHSLANQGARIGVSVLCPGWVNTRVMDAERNRPASLEVARTIPPAGLAAIAEQRQHLEAGMAPEQVAGYVFTAIAAGKFYIFTHPELKSLVRRRMEEILNEQNPILVSDVV